MLNIITIGGRLTRDPELRFTQTQKPVVSFTVACERDFAASGEKREADFIDCVAWNNVANFIHDHFVKGSAIIVTGRLQSRDWTDKDGNKRRAWEIIADRVYFGESKKQEANLAPVQGKLEDPDGEPPF